MNLQELIRIRNQLMVQQSLLDLGSYIDTARNTLLGFAVGTYYNNKTKDMAKTYDQVDELSKTVSSKFGQLIDEINLEIDRTAESMLTADYENKFRQMIRLVDDSSLSNQKTVPPAVYSRIDAHAVWKYPTLILGCRNISAVQRCINNELTYLADCDQRFIDNVTETIPEDTKRKLRQYLLTNYSQNPLFLTDRIADDLRFLNHNDSLLDFSQLPKGQMGFVFSWNLFTQVTLSTLAVYLKEVFELLRPGGLFMFDYNNCDQESAIYEFELGSKTWMPQRLVTALAQALGFEIVEYHDFYDCSYAIVRKPGELKTIKTSPVIGRKKHYGT